MQIRSVGKLALVAALAITCSSASWSQDKSTLPEFFGFYGVDGGQNVALYEGQGTGTRTIAFEGYSIPQNSTFRATIPEISTSTRFILYYSNAGEMIQSLTLHRLPLVRNVVDKTMPTPFQHSIQLQIVGSPKVPLLARIPELGFRILAKPVLNQPQMVELVASPKLTPGVYVVDYSPKGKDGWYVMFAVTSSTERESQFCMDLVLPGGPTGLFFRANSELAATVPLLAANDYAPCNASAPSNGDSGARASAESGATSPGLDPIPWTDPVTGLKWTRSDNGKDVTWKEASDYCKNLNLGGKSGWRLPEIEELRGIFDRSANVPPADRPELAGLNIQLAPNHIKGNFKLSGLELSNTSRPPTGELAFDFQTGKERSLKSDDKKWRKRALCVRSPESSATPMPASPSASSTNSASSAAASNPACSKTVDSGYALLLQGHLYKVRLAGSAGPNREPYFFDERGTQVTDSSLLSQLSSAVWTHDNVIASPDARNGSTRVSDVLGTSKALQRYTTIQNVLASAMVEAIEAGATGGASLSKAVPNLTMGILKAQLLSAPKTLLTLSAQRGLESSLAAYRQMEGVPLPPQDATAFNATDLARIKTLYLQARSLELPYEALAAKLMPIAGSELTTQALKSALGEVTAGPLFSGAPSEAVTIQDLFKLQTSIANLDKSLPALQDYKQNLNLATNLTSANNKTIAKWASAAELKCN